MLPNALVEGSLWKITKSQSGNCLSDKINITTCKINIMSSQEYEHMTDQKQSLKERRKSLPGGGISNNIHRYLALKGMACGSHGLVWAVNRHLFPEGTGGREEGGGFMVEAA